MVICVLIDFPRHNRPNELFSTDHKIESVHKINKSQEID